MALKTNYVNYVPPASGRTFALTQVSGTTYKIEDNTQYATTGDVLGATDINATNTAVNNLNSALKEITNTTVTIPASGWTGDSQHDWYYNTVAVTGVTTSTDVRIQLSDAYVLDYADIAVLAPGTGNITFVRKTPPSVNLTANVSVREVVDNG